MRLPHFPHMNAKSFIKTLYKEITQDEVFALAAQMAYYFLFSIFPLLLFSVALLGFLPIQDMTQHLLAELRVVAPREFYEIVETHLTDVVFNQRPGLLSISAIVALYSASAGVTATIQCLNRAYEVNDRRSFIKVKLIALALTCAVSVLLILSAALVVGGDAIATWIAENFGRLGEYYAMGWKVVQWLISPAAILLALALLYYFGPDVKQEWKWITPGSMAATALWLGATLGFSYYVSNFGNFNATYGSLGGVMVTMLWLYISSLVILIGGEVNAVLEHASAEGKDAGEHAPGEPSAAATEGVPVTGKPADSPHQKLAEEETRQEQGGDGGDALKQGRRQAQAQAQTQAARVYHRRGGNGNGSPGDGGGGSSSDPSGRKNDGDDLLH